MTAARTGELAAARRGLVFIFRAAPVATVASVVLDLLSGVVPALVVASTARLIDVVVRLGSGAAASPAAAQAIAVLTVALTLQRASSAALQAMQAAAGQRFSASLENRRLDALCSLPGMAHFENPASANLLSAGIRAHAPQQLVFSVGWAISVVTTLVSTGLVVAAHLPWAPLVPLVPTLLITLNRWRHAGTQRELELTESMYHHRRADYAGRTPLLPQAAREMRMFSLGTWFRQRFEDAWTRSRAPVLADLRREMVQTTALTSVRACAIAVPIIAGFVQLRGGGLSVGGFSALALGIASFTATLEGAESLPAMLRRDVQFLPEAFTILDLPLTDPRLDASGTRTAPPRLQEGIRFDDVHFSYPGTNRSVLRGLSVDVPAGTCLAIVGENGAGKSTLVKLLCRMYDPDSGRITLDGVDLRDHDLESLRARIAAVFQDFARLPLTMGENVGIGCVDRMEDHDFLAAVAHEAGAKELALSLPDQWDTLLSRDFEGGTDLSGGQWQRVALARAVAAKHGRGSSIFVLDEPTAALDVRLEHELFQRFADLTSSATTLLISHRFSTVRMADAIAVIDDGQIVERGSHEELLRQAGRYAQLFNLQAQHFAAEAQIDSEGGSVGYS